MYKVGLIGLGGMACGGDSNSKYTYSHCAGIKFCDSVELTAVCDLNEERINKFNEKWGKDFKTSIAYNDIDSMLKEQSFDIIDICTNGKYHFDIAMKVLSQDIPPRIIFIEKAPTSSLEQLDKLMAIAKQKNVRVVCSYSRHFYPLMIKASQLIKEGLIGEVKTVVGYCRGWLLSMNSHQTDMICQFAGYNPIAVTAKGSIRNIPDMSWHSIDNVPLGYEPEPDLDSMIIEYKSGVVGIQIGEHNDFWGLYCDVFGTLGRIRIQSDLLHISGYMGNDKKINVEELDLPESDGVFKVAYNQFSEYLNMGTPIDCCDDDMVAVQEIGLAAVESIKTKERISIPCKNRYSLVHIL